MVGAWWALAAEGQQRSADIEVVRPVVVAGAPIGVEGGFSDEPGTVRVAALASYAANPLVLERTGEDELRVVANRATATALVSWEATERFGLRASLPAAATWGSDPSAWDADGAGLGDLSAGARFGLLQAEHAGLALHTDLALPSGRRDAWLGESGPRLDGGLGLSVGGPRLVASLGGGVLAREPVDTEADLRVGVEGYGGLGAVLSPSERWSVHLAGVGRIGGLATIEGLAGGTVHASDAVRLDLALGHGLSNGPGATDARVLAALVWERRPPEEAPPPLPVVIDDFTVLPEEVDPPEEEAEEPSVIEALAPPDWQPTQLARVTRGQVELRDPIRFEAGTARILAESEPVLAQVADVLATTPEIIHVVIVGHASSEGSYEVNYRLSLDRAAAVYEALLARGVHPDRLSVRAMGEVAVTGEGEAAVEQARRVEFRITRALGVGELPPQYSTVGRLPFNGQERPEGDR